MVILSGFAPLYSFLLIEDGSFLLQEDGFKIGLETQPLWIPIPDGQNPNWQPIGTAQTPGWTVVTTTQSPGWTEINT